MARKNKFTAEEAKIIDSYFTNRYQKVFALKNLPEAIKGALFARYSRTHKPLRRLFLDEFYSDAMPEPVEYVPNRRAREFYHRVVDEYGDDSVMQLGSAHIAVEGYSILAAKELQRSRLAAYLEKSTRYLTYKGFNFDCVTDTRWLDNKHLVKAQEVMKNAYESGLRNYFHKDDLRGLLPVSLKTNFGIHANGQALERMVTRNSAFYNNWEVHRASTGIRTAATKVMPEFMWRANNLNYKSHAHGNINFYRQRKAGAKLFAVQSVPKPTPFVESPKATLISFGGTGELLDVMMNYRYSNSSFENMKNYLAHNNSEIRDKHHQALQRNIFKYRTNRRHLPERIFEGVNATFEIVSDYATYRDLQRHRMLTIEAQEFGPHLGFHTPYAILADNKMNTIWNQAMSDGVKAYKHYDMYTTTDDPYTRQLALPMAFNIRYLIHANLRQLMYMIELRSGPGAHSVYKSIATQMYEQLRQVCKDQLDIDFDLKFFGGKDDEFFQR